MGDEDQLRYVCGFEFIWIDDENYHKNGRNYTEHNCPQNGRNYVEYCEEYKLNNLEFESFEYLERLITTPYNPYDTFSMGHILLPTFRKLMNK